jgi:hypothetical protein
MSSLSDMPSPSPAERYTIVSADCHAGGSHDQYREYLEAAYLDDFDAWRAHYTTRSATC